MAYVQLKEGFTHLNTMLSRSDFKEVVITSTAVNHTNTALLVKLYQLGVLDAVDSEITDAVLAQKLRTAQHLFNLTEDGVLRSLTIEALNVPVRQRADALKIALGYIRWCNGLQQHRPVILINIPSANLWVYDKGKAVLDSRIIVGMPLTPTPTLSSTVTEVVLYPYWMVSGEHRHQRVIASHKKRTKPTSIEIIFRY